MTQLDPKLVMRENTKESKACCRLSAKLRPLRCHESLKAGVQERAVRQEDW